MSLRVKLFLSFAVMILLALVTALVSMGAYRKIERNVRHSRDTIDTVVGGLIPVSERWTLLSNQIVSAGLGFYSYAYGFLEKDYVSASNEIASAEKELGNLRTILSSPAAATLQESRTVADECAASIDQLKQFGQDIRQARQRLNELNANFSATQEEVTDLADVQYQAAFGALGEWLDGDGEEHGGRPAPFPPRRLCLGRI